MAHLIDKDALVAEIERRLNFDKELKLYSRADECNGILSFINTLEVKEMQDSAAASMAEEIIINLKRVENDYHIDLTKQMEWLRNIVKKGEEV